MLSRLLYVDPGLLRRGAPFFALYLVLFAALTLADGLSLTLFLQAVGSRSLPAYYSASAVCVLLAAAAYLTVVDRLDPARVFVAILAAPMTLFAAVWCLVALGGGDSRWLGLLFIGRELAFSLILLHFGAFLQQYFTRRELGGVMPVIYAGGRFGGIAGGVALERLSVMVRPIDLLLAAIGMLLLGIVGAAWIRRRVSPVEEEPGQPLAEATPAAQDEATAVQSLTGFLQFVRSNPLMFWISLTTAAYFACRAFVSFNYSRCFEATFTDEAEMARFIGRYTTCALAVSLVLQLFFVNRLIAWAGVRGAHLTYAVALALAALLGAFEMTLVTAVFARLVEAELRYALRNPTSQLIVNQFSRALRIRARAWSIGFLIPLSTLSASLALGGLLGGAWPHLVGMASACLGLGYLTCAVQLGRYCPAARPSELAIEAWPSHSAATLPMVQDQEPRPPASRPDAAVASP